MRLERRRRRTAGTQLLRAVMVAAFVAGLLSVAGCGSSDTTNGASATVQYDGQLIRAAEPICRKLNKEITVKETPGFNMAAIARLSPPHAAAELKALHELEGLTPSASVTQSWQQLLAYRQTLVKELIEFGRAAKATDVAAVKALSASKEKVHKRLFAVARHDGFRACAAVG